MKRRQRHGDPTGERKAGGDPIELFNGKDIDDWIWVTDPTKGTTTKLSEEEAIWVVKDGVLRSNGKEVAGFTPGYVREQQKFTNFVLTVEQRHVTKGGGGILIAVQGEDKVWPKNLQIQGTWGSVGDFIDQYGIKMTPGRGADQGWERCGDNEDGSEFRRSAAGGMGYGGDRGGLGMGRCG